MSHKHSPEVSGKAAADRSRHYGAAPGGLFVLLAPLFLIAGLASPAAAETIAVEQEAKISLLVGDVIALADRCASAAAREESQELTCRLAMAVPKPRTEKVLAFEEHPLFIYAVGDSQSPRVEERSHQFIRRVLFLKPDTFVIDDLVRVPASGEHASTAPDSRPASVTTRSRRRFVEGENAVVCEGILAEGTRRDKTLDVRLLCVLHVQRGDDQQPEPRWKLVEKGNRPSLTVSTAERVFQLTLPSPTEAPGEIAISKTVGETLLPRRPLAAGVLPHGPEGVRLLARWDSAYHDNRRPGWDTGRPSSNLEKLVEDRTLRPCRAVVLGCGTGTNAIYLAKKGFEVTGIDIAPTALSRAEKKAQEAGVKVRWLLADVLAPPELEPFELIFDRGCYHGVRRQNAAGYVSALGRLSQSGTRLLILAGNANEARQYGPPRVKEEEIRGDFSEGFEFRWLRETRFDTVAPSGQGALAWSILLQRK